MCCGVLLECVDQKILDGGTFKSRHAGKKSRVSLMECSIKQGMIFILRTTGTRIAEKLYILT